jgi:hypothetical protein
MTRILDRDSLGTVGNDSPSHRRTALPPPGRPADIIQRLTETAMALTPGTRLGVYQVTAIIGEGGEAASARRFVTQPSQ